MVGQVSSVYFQCYQMAYDLAKGAEACYVFERMPALSNYTSFIQFGYWDSLKKGLLSGERLYQDLKRLEIAYLDQNQRDFEITKSISLLLLDPMALINLKETGYCTVQFPEAFFDMDYPGHYLRRIKSISMTVPCVVGPYTSLNCTLTLAGNKIRVDNTAADATDYVKDSHFVTNFAASESISTSSGQNDSGLFVVNFNDERYLPFRRRRCGLHLAAIHAARYKCLRFRHHHRCHFQLEVYGPRRRRIPAICCSRRGHHAAGFSEWCISSRPDAATPAADADSHVQPASRVPERVERLSSSARCRC